MGDLVRGIRETLDDHLTLVLQKAVDETIITDDQRNRIIELADRDPTGR
jgi:hypothetical protein